MYSVIAILMVWVRARRISPGILLLAQLALPTFGFYILQERDGAVPNGWLVLMAPSLVAIGMVLRRPSNDGEIARQATNPDLHRFLKTTFWILAVLAVLHFALAGIPVLSDSVETQRFSLGSSGLGGFPSRAVLYAIPAVALISLATVTIQTRRTTIAIWILFSITQIGLGFKGGLLEVMFLAALAYLVRVARPRPKHLMLLAAGLVSALLYVEVVRSLYATSLNSPSDLGYLLDRSTTQAIESGYLALWNDPTFTSGETAFWHDFLQLMARYVGLGQPDDYTFDMLMSSVVTGTPLGLGLFIVPVTVGGPVYLIFSLPIPLVVMVLILLGWIWTWAISATARMSNLFTGVMAAILIIGIRMFLVNGNGAYLVINLLFTSILLWLCALPIWIDKLRKDSSLRNSRNHVVLKSGPSRHG
ncbi:hypothetical protein AHiyo1_41610 [Arthrobacter sp. Hiyo1]|uniref:hypothetical protein n=1 Tax=Arthrobacter sp. Hiyo1 TaxID=1588020 RepID=UPI0006A38653|nr:hypothetical protein [Arthrobacter sp. Hiyo1]GAP60601.1 hypothetical protein AHiyo1_41610 [Arthrobacter sp. Hiyo1]